MCDQVTTAVPAAVTVRETRGYIFAAPVVFFVLLRVVKLQSSTITGDHT